MNVVTRKHDIRQGALRGLARGGISAGGDNAHSAFLWRVCTALEAHGEHQPVNDPVGSPLTNHQSIRRKDLNHHAFNQESLPRVTPQDRKPGRDSARQV